MAGAGGNGGCALPAQVGQGRVALGTCSCPVTDPMTGIVTCAEGYHHRPSARACGSGPPAADGSSGNGNVAALPRADSFVDCTSDASVCNQYLYGYCGVPIGGVALCGSGCATDADCDQWSNCLCNSSSLSPTGGTCVLAYCHTDQDCGAGLLCASYHDQCGEIPNQFICQTDADLCESPTDCADGSACVYYAPSGGGTAALGQARRECKNVGNIICSQ